MPDTASPRIAPLAPPFDAATDRLLHNMMSSRDREPLKLFRTVARNPRLLRNFADNGKLVYHRETDIAPPERELIIQRTTARCGAEYEWGVHAYVFGPRVGLTGERLHATVAGNGESPCWSKRERLLVEFADSLHDRSDIDDALWERMRGFWSEEQILELAMLAGLYHAISYVIRVARIECEDYGARFAGPSGT